MDFIFEWKIMCEFFHVKSNELTFIKRFRNSLKLHIVTFPKKRVAGFYLFVNGVPFYPTIGISHLLTTTTFQGQNEITLN